MDVNEVPLKEGDLITFNPAGWYHRQDHRFARIKKIHPKGKLEIERVPVERQITCSNGLQHSETLIPQWDKEGVRETMLPKRGKNEAAGFYRYNKNDTLIDLYQPDQEYYNNTYY